MSTACAKPLLLTLLLCASCVAPASAGANRDKIYATVMKKWQPYRDCITKAAQKYQVPEWFLLAMLKHERGPVNGYLNNPNGTKDYGIACINDVRIADFHASGMTYVTPELLMNDPCFNIQAAAYLLKLEQIKERDRQGKSHDWFVITANYHYNYRGKYPANHDRYKQKIEATMSSFAASLNK